MKNQTLTPSEMAEIAEQRDRRFIAAAMAMQGLLADPSLIATPEQITETAVIYADLLINKLNEPQDAEATN